MKWKLEREMQGFFTGWLRRASGGALIHKISDSGVGIKPFDCFMIGAGNNTEVYGLIGCNSAGFELKLAGHNGRVAYGELFKGTRGAQLHALDKCWGSGCGGFYVFGFSRGAKAPRVYAVDSRIMEEERREYVSEGGRRSLQERFCEKKGVRIL